MVLFRSILLTILCLFINNCIFSCVNVDFSLFILKLETQSICSRSFSMSFLYIQRYLFIRYSLLITCCKIYLLLVSKITRYLFQNPLAARYKFHLSCKNHSLQKLLITLCKSNLLSLSVPKTTRYL